MQRYYALENVVYTGDGRVACVVSPVWFLKAVANRAAIAIAYQMNDYEDNEKDVLRGSLD